MIAPARLPVERPLRRRERGRLAAEILTGYLVTRRELARAEIETVIGRLRSGQRAPTDPRAGSLLEARRLGHAVSRTLALAPGDTRCLVRSLVLTRMLARRGIAGTLVIGARTDPEFLAHAWVEHEGEPVLSTGGGSFGRLVEL